jgi:uncharacterized protein (TIGR03437 family)
MVFHVSQNIVAPFTKDYIPGADLMALNEDGTLNAEDNPAPRGSILTMYATGLGPNVNLQDGQIVPDAVPVNTGLVINFFPKPYGTPIPAMILYQGSAPGEIAGFYQLNVRIPATAMTGHTWVQFAMGLDSEYYTTSEGVWLK